MISIYIIDDEVLISYGLQAILRSESCNITVAGFSHRLDYALCEIKENPCDIIILDLFIGYADPVESYNKVTDSFPEIPVIIHTKETTLVWKWRMILAGVSGFVVKGWDLEAFTETVYRVAEGEIVYPAELELVITLKNLSKGFQTVRPKDLDIIRKRDRGYQNKEIAMEFGISEKAVEKQLHKLCEIFGMESVKELIQFFCRPNVNFLAY